MWLAWWRSGFSFFREKVFLWDVCGPLNRVLGVGKNRTPLCFFVFLFFCWGFVCATRRPRGRGREACGGVCAPRGAPRVGDMTGTFGFLAFGERKGARARHPQSRKGPDPARRGPTRHDLFGFWGSALFVLLKARKQNEQLQPRILGLTRAGSGVARAGR